ncbi:MAG: DUF998 domain-containing protein [Streptosporangiaceae bacterium]
MAAGPVFVAVFLFEGAVRDGYRPLRHPVSSLALGPRGWIQAGNFAATGTLRAGNPAGTQGQWTFSAGECSRRPSISGAVQPGRDREPPGHSGSRDHLAL